MLDKKHLLTHLLSLGLLCVGFCLSTLIRSNIGWTGKFLALFALVMILCSFFMGGKLVPLITSSGYFVCFLFAFFFQRDSMDPGVGPTNNMGRLWIISFFVIFVLSLYFESVYAHKRLQ